MSNLTSKSKPALILCINDQEIEEFILNLNVSLDFSSVYISSYNELIADIEKKRAGTVVLKFTDLNVENLKFLSDIKSRYPHLDVICIYNFENKDENIIEYRMEVLKNGAIDFINYPEQSVYLELRLNNSYNKQMSLMELNTSFEFWNSINKALKSIISDINSPDFYKRIVKQLLSLTKSDLGGLIILKNSKVDYIYAWDGSNWIEQDNPDVDFSLNLYDLQLEDYFIILEDSEIANNNNFPVYFRDQNIRSYMNFPIYNKGKKLIGMFEAYKTSGKYDISLHPMLIKIILESLPFEKYTVQKKEKRDKVPGATYDNTYLGVLDSIPLIIFIIKNDSIQFVNNAACSLLGFDKRDLANKNFSTVCADKLFATKDSGEKNSPADINSGEINLEFKRKKQKSIKLKGNIQFITHRNENALLITASAPSVKPADKSTEDEALRLAAAVKSLKSAVTITDMDRNIIYVNPGHKNIFGYDPEELIGNKSNILFSIQDPSGISDKIFDAILTVGWEGERISVKKSGEVFPAYEKISMVKDQNGNPLGIISIIDEISARKRLEQALKDSEERYRTLVETANTAIIAADENEDIILFNPHAEALFEYPFEEAREKKLSIMVSELKNASVNSESGENILDSYIGKTVELSGIKKDGSAFPVEITLSKCFIEGREIYTAIIMDITERKNLQNQLIQSAKLAAVGELISGITHEVNNPLAVVMGYAEMMKTEPNLNEEMLKGVNIIYNESEKARKVIQNMLAFARQHAPEKEPIVINNVIQKTLDLADFDLRKNGIKVIKDFDDNIPKILGESNQLEQVFLNLFINAQHAISEEKKKGSITIKTNLVNPETGDSGSNGFVNVSVTDDGPGIPKKIIDNIFDPFFTTKPVGKGTGLGLSVSLGIIKDHNGIIDVQSDEKHGTCFNIKFPIHHAS